MSNIVQSPIGGDREGRGKVGKIKKKGLGNIDGGGGLQKIGKLGPLCQLCKA